MRGLKHYFMCHIDDQTPVASFTDAWIETRHILQRVIQIEVASFTDAWIETFIKRGSVFRMQSHLLQMRGLKHGLIIVQKVRSESHLLQMRGLKQMLVCMMIFSLRRIFYRCVD